ncbi:MAG: hypothetical protein SVR04_00305, partial [Spirochaetota bacterium]|nr:hypothetical protein [Spirochaetota bacterium]
GTGAAYNTDHDNVGYLNLDSVPGYDSTGPTIIVADTLRASVEAASGGRVTVLYDDLGLPSYMVRIPAFNLEDIHADFGTGRHPAFLVNGVKKSEIFVGMHLASVYQNRAISIPGLDPAVLINWDTASLRCTAKGSGWHLMTNWEWAAVVLWIMKQVTDGVLPGQPRGNTNYGRAHDEYQETGTRQDGGTYDPGEATGTARTLTGSGPAAWHHDFSPAGIADMVGNVWEWTGGLKIVDGAIKMPNDNYYTQSDSLWADQAATVTSSGTWSTDRTSGGDAARLRAALIKPATAVTNGVNGYCYIDATGERMPRRGGNWGNGSNAGLGALNLNTLRSNSNTYIGFRPAFVAP